MKREAMFVLLCLPSPILCFLGVFFFFPLFLMFTCGELGTVNVRHEEFLSAYGHGVLGEMSSQDSMASPLWASA